MNFYISGIDKRFSYLRAMLLEQGLSEAVPADLGIFAPREPVLNSLNNLKPGAHI